MALECFSLGRLQRFAQLAAESDALAAVVPAQADDRDPFNWRRLAHHAAFSANRDCVALGLEPSARRVLDRSVGHRQLAR